MAVERDISVKVKLKGADKFKKDMSSVSSSMSTGFAEIAKGILTADVIKSAISAVVNGISDCVDASIEFDSALAGVAKTTDLSDVGLRNIGNQLINLSEQIPTSASELAGLAETAGQLGIASESIIDFTEVVAAMGVSTNLSAQDAATALAQIATVFGTSSDDYERMGSAIVELGNNFATTESDIVEMSQKMAGSAAVAGISEADMFGFSAAISSLGIEAQAGGSSIQRLISAIQLAIASGDVAGFAEVCGTTSDEFKKLWANDPTEAILRFVEGLSQLNASGGNATKTLSDLGLSNVNIMRTLLGMANAGDFTRTAIETANSAWEENIALTTEAEKRYSTWASRKEIADNKLENAQISVGDMFSEGVIGAYEDVADIVSNATKSLREINLADEIEKANNAYEEQAAEIQRTTSMARDLADQIASMGDYSQLNTDEQREFNATLAALESIMPGVTSAWNETTGAFDGGTDAMYSAITASEELALAQANATKTREQADAYTIVADSVDDLSQAYALAGAEAKAYYAQAEEYMKEQLSLNPAWAADMDSYYLGLINSAGEAAQQQEKLEKQISENSAQLEEYAYVTDEYTEAVDKYSDAVDGASSSTDSMSTDMLAAYNQLEELSGQLDTLRTEYSEVKDTVRDTLDNSVTGFSKIELPEVETPEEMIEGLDSQLSYLEDYGTNMEKAVEMGIDKDLLSSLADGSTESAAILEQLVNADDDELAAIQEKMSAVTAQKEELSAQLAEVQTGFTEASTAVVEQANALVDGVDVSSQTYTKGAQDIQSLINGINSKIGTLSTKVGVVKGLMNQLGSGGTVSGSHAAGLSYVPFDGYLAQLHRGEMVLTALEAKAYRAEQFTNYGMIAALDRKNASTTTNDNRRYESPINTSVRFGNVYVQKESDIDTLSRKLAKMNAKTSKGVGC